MQPAIVCFSHLRWNFVYQRPQHILSRLARHHPVFYIEEPVFEADVEPFYEIYSDSSSVNVVIPHLPHGLSEKEQRLRQGQMTDHLLSSFQVKDHILWYYAPMAFAFTRHLSPRYVVYDCMDELSAFLFAPEALRENEAGLIARADLVFTGGRSLYLAKKCLHKNIHCFPSSIDKVHFKKARRGCVDPPDQMSIPFPRIGFFGVIDERLDTDLLGAVAAARPDWQFILVGPVVKIDPATLPKAPNIHYMGQRSYAELPAYLGGWNIAMMPFARNASTKFISPTKTPEYLAGGKPVIAPSIADVIHPYGDLGLVAIADTPGEFIEAATDILQRGHSEQWLRQVDDYLDDLSWDDTVARMRALMEKGLREKNISLVQKPGSYV